MFLDIIRNRRSIRKYQRKAVEPEKLELLVEAALRTPSSRGLNPWEFIVVSKPELLEPMANTKPYSSFIKEASLAIVICADPERCDVWIEDASIAATYIQLAAESLGLGSCWVQIRERMHDNSKTAEDYLRELLEIPDNLKVEAVIAIGYPDEKPLPHPAEQLQYQKVFQNKYGEKY